MNAESLKVKIHRSYSLWIEGKKKSQHLDKDLQLGVRLEGNTNTHNHKKTIENLQLAKGLNLWDTRPLLL